jgi:glycosyltransferase involved in cell wall biosynthesis
MDQPLVSILIPCYNAEKYVGEAIESALAQTYPNVEVIVVDDGSTDGSLGVIKSFSSRIRWETGPNRGGCAARNRAFELSHGDFVQFLDGDDYLLPDKVAIQLPFLTGNQADLVFCAGRTLLLSGKIQEPGHYPSPQGIDPLLYVLKYVITTNGSLHRRTCLEQVGGFRVGLPRAQEWDLHVRLAGAGARLAVIDRPMFVKRQHDGPQVSKTTTSPAYLPTLLFDNIEAFESAGWMDNTERRSSVASIVYRHSAYAYRNGHSETARRGFQLARRLSSRYPVPERWWVRSLVQSVGPWNTERLLQMGRSMKRMLPISGSAEAQT